MTASNHVPQSRKNKELFIIEVKRDLGTQDCDLDVVIVDVADLRFELGANSARRKRNGSWLCGPMINLGSVSERRRNKKIRP